MEQISESYYFTWKASTFGDLYHIHNNGLPVGAVTSLTGSARSHAIRMLIVGVKTRDGHAGTALAAMGETSTLPYLRAALKTVSGQDKVCFARAIHELSLGEDATAMAKELVSVLEAKHMNFGAKIDSAAGLKVFGDQESEQALCRAIEEQDHYLVRIHACESLLVRWKIKPTGISSHPAIFSLICNARKEDNIKDKSQRGREALRLLAQLKN